MGWLIFSVCMLIIFGIIKTNQDKEIEEATDRFIEEYSAKVVESLTSSMEIAFPDPKDAKREPHRKAGLEYTQVNAFDHMSIGGKPINAITEACDQCGKGYYVFYADDGVEADQIHCPFCGKIHLQDKV